MENPIRRSAAPVSGADLDALEAALGLTLPADYRAFLLAHNGGVPRRNKFTHVHKPGQKRETWLKWIYCVGREGLLDPDAEDLLSAARARPAGLPAGLLPAASAYFLGNFGFVCVACHGDNAGKVFFRPLVEPEKTTAYPVADSWTAFLAGLEHEDGQAKTWKVAIEDGDAAALRRWLVENQGWRKDCAQALNILRAAVEENHWPSVAVLLDLGIDTDDLFHDALISDRPDLVLGILRSGKVPAKTVANALARASHVLWHLPALLEELIAAGADPDAQNHSGETPLHRAVEAGSEDGIRLLLAHGANPTLMNDDGLTPLDQTVRFEQGRLADLLIEGEEAWADAHPADDGPELVEFDLCGVTLGKAGPPLTFEEILAFEDTLRFTLPPEYRFLLLNANGGVPTPNRLPLTVDREDEGDEEDEEYPSESEPALAAFFRLRRDDRSPEHEHRADVFTVEEMLEWYNDGVEIPRNRVAIGSLAGYGYEGFGFLLLGCAGKDRGRLFAFEYEETPLELTLPELFAALGAGKERTASPHERLAAAIEARDLPSVRAALADGANPRKALGDGEVPILLACEAGFDDAVMAMAEAGVKLDHLFEYAVMTGRFALVGRLLAHGKGPSKQALNEALTTNPDLYAEVELVKAMVARGAYLNGIHGGEPRSLLLAARSGSREGLTLVLGAGHSPLYRDREGATLLHHAASASAEAEGAADVIRFLLELGVQVNQPDTLGHTALHKAVLAGNLAAAKALIDAGEDLQARHPLPTAESLPGGGNAILGMLQSLMQNQDGPPPPDTSTPLGAMIAQAQANLSQRMEVFGAALQARIASGEQGKGPSAAELGRSRGYLQPFMKKLEAYAAGKGPKRE